MFVSHTRKDDQVVFSRVADRHHFKQAETPASNRPPPPPAPGPASALVSAPLRSPRWSRVQQPPKCHLSHLRFNAATGRIRQRTTQTMVPKLAPRSRRPNQQRRRRPGRELSTRSRRRRSRSRCRHFGRPPPASRIIEARRRFLATPKCTSCSQARYLCRSRAALFCTQRIRCHSIRPCCCPSTAELRYARQAGAGRRAQCACRSSGEDHCVTATATDIQNRVTQRRYSKTVERSSPVLRCTTVLHLFLLALL